MTCDFSPGEGPIVLAFPHASTWLPRGFAERLNDRGRELVDTDWRIDELYEGLCPSASRVTAAFHRYWIDANRSPEDRSLYPGRATTGLCPVTDFDGAPIYASGEEPDREEASRERLPYHQGYHSVLENALNDARARHGVAILFDCHSIRSRIPRLFEGELPHLNVGDFDGRSCDPRITETVARICRDGSARSTVVNGRFKGGWTTRRYGRPKAGVHAIQLEIAQRAYMNEQPPWTIDPARAGRLRGTLKNILDALDLLARSGELGRPS